MTFALFKELKLRTLIYTILESQALFTVYRDKNIVLVFLQELNPQFLYGA